MLQAGIEVIWLALYHYYIEQIGELEKGYVKRIVALALTLGTLMLVHLPFHGWDGPWHHFAGWLVITLILFLYMLFYDGKPFKYQWWKALAPGILMSVCSMMQEWPVLPLGAEPTALVLCTGVVAVVLLLLLGYERGHLRVWNGLLNLAVYVLLGTIYFMVQYDLIQDSQRPNDHPYHVWFVHKVYSDLIQDSQRPNGHPYHVRFVHKVYSDLIQDSQRPNDHPYHVRFMHKVYSVRGWETGAETGLSAGILTMELLLFFSLEGTLFSYQRGFEAQTERFQRDILGHQY